MENKKVVKITNDSISELSKAYNNSNENGKLINNFISLFKEDKQKNIIDLINEIDKDLFKRTDLLQRVVINGIITTSILKYKNKNDDVFINNILYQCNSLYKNELWLNSMKEIVIPFLIENNII